jgi:acyl transferase domain-containing protein/acyl carrier protein
MTNDEKLREYLKRVTVELHETRGRLREVEGQQREPVAVVGMSCRYPGGIASPAQLWETVSAGREVISEFPADRGWDLNRLYVPYPGRAGATYVNEAGFLYEATKFDADFFSISPKEALAMSPQQRLLLEGAWEAIEDANIDPSMLHGSQTGVFAGASSDGYGLGLLESPPDGEEGYASTGILGSVLSGRVSYVLGLEGPAVSIDTACSSSLVALHLACGSLRSGECSLALAGGVCVISMPNMFVEMARQRGLAPDGRCKSFAEAADGTNWSEGVGVVLLERLSEAERLGHRVLAVVRGSAVNQDGASNGLTAPNGPSQRRVIKRALENSGLTPDQVDVVEGHGTGTTLGDPIEARALVATYGQRAARHPLWLGSIKSNMGHAQAAGGIAGLIKMVMAFQHETLPKTLHVDRPSDKVNWSDGEISLLTESLHWPKGEEPRRAGVSSFGVSGTNAHVILEEAPEPAVKTSPSPVAGDELSASRLGLIGEGILPLVVSGHNEAALREQAGRLSTFISTAAELADAGNSLARRSTFARRAVVVGGDRQALLAGLDALAGDVSAVGLVRESAGTNGAGGVVFVFPGQGSQWPGMALQLLDCSDVFATRFRECGAALAEHTDWSLEDVVRGVAGAASLERVDVVQPALFAVMVALAEVWRTCGVKPDVVVGHSQGEIAAACVAGALSLDDAARVVAIRSRALLALAGLGGMVSLSAGPPEVEARLEHYGSEISIAAVNGPRSVVVSGTLDRLEHLLRDCEADGVKARKIPVDYAAHSAQVERIEQELLEGCAGIVPRAAGVPFYSAVTGGLLDGAKLDADYWYRNLRHTVRFDVAASAVLDEGARTFIEVSPHPVLTVALQEIVEARKLADASVSANGQSTSAERESDVGAAGARVMADAGVAILGSLRREDGGRMRLLTSLGEAWVHGAQVDWKALFDETGAGVSQLPTYAFQRKRYWLDDASGPVTDLAAAGQSTTRHPLLSAAVALAADDSWLFTGRVSLDSQPWLADHVLAGMVFVPGTTYLDLALHAGAEVGCEVLEDLVFEAPLILSDGNAVQLQLVLDAPDELGRRGVAIFTRPDADATNDLWDERTWTRHARGMLAPVEALSGGPTSLEEKAGAFAVESWPPSGAEPVPVADVYDYFARLGLDYGPAFLGIRAAWRSDGQAFAEVTLPQDEWERAKSFRLHPALLDVMTQVGAIHMLADGAPPIEGPVLPFAWTKVSVLAKGMVSVRVCAAPSATGGMSIVVADEQGRPVLAAESFVLRAVPEGQFAALRSGQRNDSLFELDWSAIPATPPGPELVSRWAELGDRHFVEPAPSDAAPELEHAVYADLNALLEAIDSGTPAPAASLVYLDARADSDQGQPAVAAHRLAERVLALVQGWLADARLARSRLVIATDGAVSAGDGDQLSDLAGATIWGLIRSVQTECPGRFVLIDVDRNDADGLKAAMAGALAGDEPQMAWRAGKLLVPRMKRAVPVSSNGEQAQPGRESATLAQVGLTRAGEPGTVLITGGTGALGGLLSRHLVRAHGVRNLLLTSRQGRGSSGAEELERELAELGATVTIAACDISDRDQLAGLLATVPQERPLSAVVHMAGVLDDGVIDSMTPERIDRVLAPKVDGAWHLHELTEQLELSAFILFSSSTGTLGGPAQGNYAAANAFLDALAVYRREHGLPATSLAWGWWATTDGMVGDLSEIDRARMRQGGILPLSAEEGVELFDLAYALDRAQVLPIRLDAAALQAQIRSSGMVPPLLRGLVRLPTSPTANAVRGSLARRLMSKSESERGRLALDMVRSEIAVVLGHTSLEDIDAQRPFSELGFDSLAAVELRNRLSIVSGVQLPATVVFDYPTPSGLSDFLVCEIVASADATVGSSEDDNQARVSDFRDAVASIPLDRLREAGVMATLVRLTGQADPTQPDLEDNSIDQIDEMDVESLLELTLGQENAVGDSLERS